ncbi:alpha/beta fold hydrolase [Sphingobium sp. SCG-1]|uniref:alpha/beta fold hydrolase n=1 Tax=Sphingobium sp. SCG-1 TaxID=2072936 RepID=UPI0016717585|nr:alpha/beta hydrolase [Sphingobium sp. SCG-1]
MTAATIVLIPGLMNDGWVWTGQLGSLSRMGPVYVACNDGLTTLADMADRILETTQGPLIAVGHSMGGRVALEMIARAPDRVIALALVSTGAHGARETEAASRQTLVDLAITDGMTAVARAWMPGMMSASTPEETRRAIQAMIERADAKVFAGQQHALLNRPDRLRFVASLCLPTLIVTGDADTWASPTQHEELAHAISGSRLEIVEVAGHMLPAEAPDALTTLLHAFILENLQAQQSSEDANFASIGTE